MNDNVVVKFTLHLANKKKRIRFFRAWLLSFRNLENSKKSVEIDHCKIIKIFSEELL